MSIHLSRRAPHPLSLPNNTLSVESSSPPSFGTDQCEPVEILPYLFLGSEVHASSKAILEKLGINSLLNVSQTCPNHFEDIFTYKCIPVEDSGAEDISIYFNEAIEFIDSVKKSNGKVLVHCHAGISRSSTICMAYLMATHKYRMEEAYEFVKSRRRCVSPNFNFMEQLLTFENHVFPASDSEEEEQHKNRPESSAEGSESLASGSDGPDECHDVEQEEENSRSSLDDQSIDIPNFVD